ncbi:MAG TPA: GYD domain-containing protein [Longimicrobiaceae bacterium]|nr:GYD domain-containing protein [Longimicrobiaceae bacterium]
MPTYIQLYRWTDQGIRNVKDSPDRVVAAAQAIQSMGGELTSIHVTMGQYDFVGVLEAPDDDTAAKFALALGAGGNIRTETLRAFSLDEFRQLMAALP